MGAFKNDSREQSEKPKIVHGKWQIESTHVYIIVAMAQRANCQKHNASKVQSGELTSAPTAQYHRT
jgi:hypothetical protein